MMDIWLEDLRVNTEEIMKNPKINTKNQQMDKQSQLMEMINLVVKPYKTEENDS